MGNIIKCKRSEGWKGGQFCPVVASLTAYSCLSPSGQDLLCWPRSPVAWGLWSCKRLFVCHEVERVGAAPLSSHTAVNTDWVGWARPACLYSLVNPIRNFLKQVCVTLLLLFTILSCMSFTQGQLVFVV